MMAGEERSAGVALGSGNSASAGASLASADLYTPIFIFFLELITTDRFRALAKLCLKLNGASRSLSANRCSSRQRLVFVNDSSEREEQGGSLVNFCARYGKLKSIFSGNEGLPPIVPIV